MKSLNDELTEKKALNRIKWDENLDESDYMIRYVDRASNKLKEVSYPKIELCGDFFMIEGSLIPMHRIRKIIYRDKIVWDRRK